MLRSGATSFYEADGPDTITSLTTTFDSFGKQTASSGSLTNPFQYTARESDRETGLYYYRARYYDPSTGRFLSEDPIGYEGGNSFYVYADNDPLNELDPSGLVVCAYSVAYHTLTCVSDDGSQWFVSNRIRSGFGSKCVNSRPCEAKSGGSIPEGGWSLGAYGSTPVPHSPPRIPIWRNRSTNDFGRGGGFQIHPGRGFFSSKGCIAMDPDEYWRFVTFFMGDNHGTLQVLP